MSVDSTELRRKAFDEFKKIAKAETANGAETLGLFRLVPQFSNAPAKDTECLTVCMRYWSRNGDADALLQYGSELFSWTNSNHP